MKQDEITKISKIKYESNNKNIKHIKQDEINNSRRVIIA